MKETTEEDIRIKLEAEVKIHNLEDRVANLEKTINILTILCNEFAKKHGIRVEKFQNGIVVISQMEK